MTELVSFILGLFGTDRTCVGPVFEKVFIVPATALDDLVAAGPDTSDTGAGLSVQDGCGASPHSRISFRWVHRTDIPTPVPRLGGGPAPKVTTISPLAAGRPSTWAGSYGNTDNVDFADVTVELTAASPDPPLTLASPSPPANPGGAAGTAQVFNAPHVAVKLLDRFQKSSPMTVNETQVAR